MRQRKANGPVTGTGICVCVVEVSVIGAPQEPSAIVIHPQTRAATEAVDICNYIRRKGSLYIT